MAGQAGRHGWNDASASKVEKAYATHITGAVLGKRHVTPSRHKRRQRSISSISGRYSIIPRTGVLTLLVYTSRARFLPVNVPENRISRGVLGLGGWGKELSG